MQLMHAADVPVSQRDRVFYYSRRRALGGVALTIIGAGTVSYLIGLKRPALGYYILVVVGIVMWLFRKMLTARFHPANWLVRLTDDGMLIKFRSYLNNHFPDQEPTVIFIPHTEILSARQVVEKQELPDRDDNNRPTSSIKTIKFVELDLAGDTKLLAEALLRERRYAIDGKAQLKITRRYHHLPVRLPTADKLQIEWKVVPSAASLLDALSHHTRILAAEKTSRDFAGLAQLSREEQENRLLELAESGDKIGAIAAARRIYGYNLAQAKEFVEGLARKLS